MAEVGVKVLIVRLRDLVKQVLEGMIKALDHGKLAPVTRCDICIGLVC